MLHLSIFFTGGQAHPDVTVTIPDDLEFSLTEVTSANFENLDPIFNEHENGATIISPANIILRIEMGAFVAKLLRKADRSTVSAMIGCELPVDTYNESTNETENVVCLSIISVKTVAENRAKGNMTVMVNEVIKSMRDRHGKCCVFQVAKSGMSSFSQELTSWIRPIGIQNCMRIGLDCMIGTDAETPMDAARMRNKTLFPRYAGTRPMNRIGRDIAPSVYEKYREVTKRFNIRFNPSVEQWCKMFQDKSAIIGFFDENAILLVEIVLVKIGESIAKCASILMYCSVPDTDKRLAAKRIVESIASIGAFIDYISCYESASLDAGILESADFRRTDCGEFLYLNGLNVSNYPDSVDTICVPLY